MARFDLTDFEWSVIQLLLSNKPRGVARVDDRRVLNGIFWRLRTGRPAHHLREPLQQVRKAASGIGFWKRCQRLTMATSR